MASLRALPVKTAQRGRPKQPEPTLQVPHPIDIRKVLSLPASRIALWCGVSLATARRWCRLPVSLPVAQRRLLELYAHGLPPIPPEHWQDKSAAAWLQFSFYFERDPAWSKCKGGQWMLSMPGQRPANWCQVHALYVTLPAYSRLLAEWQRHSQRMTAAEAEAARWREVVAYQQA